jgi:hypothetical protein
LLLSGCAGVVSLSSRTKTPAHQEINQKVSAKFIVAGQTTKADVLANLKPVDAGVESDRFFLGRWSTSNKGGWIFLRGYSSCAGGSSRPWKNTNALVEFDDHDVVARYAVFGDGSVVARLSALAAQEKPVGFDPPRELQVGGGYSGGGGGPRRSFSAKTSSSPRNCIQGWPFSFLNLHNGFSNQPGRGGECPGWTGRNFSAAIRANSLQPEN